MFQFQKWPSFKLISLIKLLGTLPEALNKPVLVLNSVHLRPRLTYLSIFIRAISKNSHVRGIFWNSKILNSNLISRRRLETRFETDKRNKTLEFFTSNYSGAIFWIIFCKKRLVFSKKEFISSKNLCKIQSQWK